MRAPARLLKPLACCAMLAACLAPAGLPAQPRTWQGTVVHITDGDTVWVRPGRGGRAVQVRLLDIDAPEACQPFGEEAREALRRRVLHRPVSVERRGRDDYRRVLARLHLSGQDINAWMVSQGLAWSYRYRGRRGPYDALQVQARHARLGLWSAPAPMEPRVFRQWHGSCATPAAGASQRGAPTVSPRPAPTR